MITFLQTFDIFSKHSGLLLNKSKCEVCGIRVKRGVNVALSGLKCIDLIKECIRILGVSYSYNEECSKNADFIEAVKKIENVVQTWKCRNFTFSAIITIFKSLAFSKIVFISVLSCVPTCIIDRLEKFRETSYGTEKGPK